ncbi:hypothetical protein P154DRAFT_463278 [Amniculicola lignicola CBS 123094]|uniref:Inner centromere protein ARK-binding domain-containing protein n=1 Tax=Amniculicola lignicola CBS 123094 TaxID=1392246 RepID=A0A6A5WLG6_9PLEO|nr:hypothetical protein P154DRAFT_463278 [Amniculicola lignicola CBS 123094]
MAPTRSKASAIGSAQWILDERHQANDLVQQEVEDFGFCVRNELEWLNEHMAEIFAHNGQHNLEVFKTPGKLRGKTPRTARKKHAAAARQPLANIFSPNAQHRVSPAQRGLQANLHKHLAKARFQIAEDTENAVPVRSPAAKSPAPRHLFSQPLGKGKENKDSGYHAPTSEDETPRPLSRPVPAPVPAPARSSLGHSTQDTAMDTQDSTQIFSQPNTQSTAATQSFRRSIPPSDDERRDTGESFVSAKEDLASRNASRENLREDADDEEMDVDATGSEDNTDAQATTIHHEAVEYTTLVRNEPLKSPHQPRVIPEAYSIGADTQDALDARHNRALAPEPKSMKPAAPSEHFMPTETHASTAFASQDDTVVHHDVDDQMDIDDDVRSPSDGSSPVKPLFRKSSLTFASLPAREPLLPKKSFGARTSHVDKARNSQLGRFTGGKSLGGSQNAYTVETHHDDVMDLDEETRREESETTRLHNKTNTQRLHERLNMLNQKNEPPMRSSRSIIASQPQQSQQSQPSQPQSQTLVASQPSQPTQPAYPMLPSEEQKDAEDEDDDDWISPVRTTAPVLNAGRPALSKSYSADPPPSFMKPPPLAKPISVSNPDLKSVVGSSTPAGSPTGKRYMDAPLSASKAKFYSALRAAKEKIIGSSATSAQVKLDALAEGPMRPKLHAQQSSDDVFSPKRNEKAGTSIFSHLRSPSKESLRTMKSSKTVASVPGSPTKDGRRTRSSSEREKQKEREAREKEVKELQRADAKLREMREKEQSKAAAHYQKAKAAASKTPVAAAPPPVFRAPATMKTPSAPPQALSRPGTIRTNTASRQQDADSADEMPPPPPPKSLLPTGTGHKLREPKRLAKPPSKDTLQKAKPQAIKVNLHSRFGQGPPVPAKSASQVAPRVVPQEPKPAPAPTRAPTAPKMAPAPKVAAPAPKPAARVGRPPQPAKAMEKPKAAPAPGRADLAGVRPVSRLQTVQDANRINVPPVNTAKPPPKRPFQPENDEPLQRPAKRPSQMAKSKPVTPAHAQFARGEIPFAESTRPDTIKTPQYPNGEDIKLPEIMTDSEDEDSENEFQQPDWVNTPNLRDMLTTQQLVDPEHIFGPIAPLNMEQVFPNKERHKRFRERTSSAYWANDGVTEEERRKEREARERLVREGGWSYNPSPGPSAAVQR